MFLSLKDFDHLLNEPKVKFKEELVLGKSVTIISYMIADSDYWKIPNAIETRGHCFDTETGECLALTFPKFFNVGEREDTQLHNLPWNDDFVVSSKIDGSMIIPVLIDGQIIFKTKKSFYSDVANYANEVAPDEVKDFCKYFIKNGYTPIFEFTSPQNKIVINYGKDPEFTLLAVRNMFNGKFIDQDMVDLIAKDYGIKTTSIFNKTKDKLLSDVQNLKDFEGYVIHFKNGQIVKLKTNWYLENHRLHTELRVRDVAEMVINETIDDCKSMVVLAGLDINEIVNIESQVIAELYKLRTEVDSIYNTDVVINNLSIKDIALKNKSNPLFTLIMQRVRDMEPKYSDYWKKHFLSKYSLQCLFNSSF